MTTTVDDTTTCLSRALIDRHFAGVITPRDERTMRDHLATSSCAACASHYKRHLLFATLDPTALPPEERIGRALGVRKASRRYMLPIASTIVAIAAALLFVLRPASGDNGFTSRGSMHDAHNVSSLATTTESKIAVFRIAHDADGADHPTLASDGMIARDDELAFVYENGEHKRFLMIFGVNERGRVYWFHPAWTVESDTPTAIRIDDTSAQPHELREAIRHQFEGEKLEIHGLFLDAPLTVRDAEVAVRNRKTETLPVVVPSGSDHVTMFGMLR